MWQGLLGRGFPELLSTAVCLGLWSQKFEMDSSTLQGMFDSSELE